MNNNKNKESQLKLEREIWLFEQWLSGMADQAGDTQERIRQAYRECIIHRQLELAKLKFECKVFEFNPSETNVPEVSACSS